jgi:hypothetical protein
MRRQRQFTIAALMTLVLGSAIVLALARDPIVRSALTGLAIGSVLLAGVTFVVYLSVGCILWTSVGCILLIDRLFRWLRYRKW